MAPLVSSRRIQNHQLQAAKVQHKPSQHQGPTTLHAPPRLHDTRKSRYGHRLRSSHRSADHNWRPRQVDNLESGGSLERSLAATPTSSIDPTVIASPSETSRPHVPPMPHGSSDIVFIAVGSAIAVLLISISVFLIVRAHWFSLSSAFKCCYRRPKPRGIGFSPSKISRPMPLDDDDDDLYMNAPTTFVYVEQFGGPPQLQLEKADDRDLFTSIQLETAFSRIIAPSQSCPTTTAGTPRDKVTGNDDNPQAMGHTISLEARAPALCGRPRGESDASQPSSSESSETEETDLTALFLPNLVGSCRSSMTSMASIISIDGISSAEEYEEEVFEVKRAHSQSIEYKKGVLMAFASQASGLSQSSSAPVESPSIVISEPSPIATAKSCSTIYSRSGSCSSRLSIIGLNTGLSISSLSCENSVGTVSSISSRSSLGTRSETSCAAEADHSQAQPRIPYLMVTQPSSSSLYTLSTQTSSVSVNLGDFPIPPAMAKPTKPLYMKLMEQAKSHALETHKRAWRNHPKDSSLKQRRSTVEQFIMMYASA